MGNNNTTGNDFVFSNANIKIDIHNSILLLLFE